MNEIRRKRRVIKVIGGVKKTIPKGADWLSHNTTSIPLCQVELSRASDGDGKVLDLKAFEEPENGAVLAEIIVH